MTTDRVSSLVIDYNQRVHDYQPTVGSKGITKIEAYNEFSGSDYVLWFAICVGEAHNALEKELAPTSRKAVKKPAISATAQKEQHENQNKGLCAFVYPDRSHCNSPEDNPIHDVHGGYAGYHEFEDPKPVARVPRKSKQKSEIPSSIPSIEDETENVL